VGEVEHRRALEQLFADHERALFNVAYRYVWNAEDARDVVQDAFVRLWRKRERVDWPRAAGLAYTIVLGLASNRRRGQRIRRAIVGWWEGDAADAAATADARLVDAERDAAARGAIDALPERLRSVLVMCAFSDLDHAAIGAILGIPAGTVGSRRHEALVRIRAMVARDERASETR
jgi:RNA polymerase sigma-70 factor (ECF subfamily)